MLKTFTSNIFAGGVGAALASVYYVPTIGQGQYFATVAVCGLLVASIDLVLTLLTAGLKAVFKDA